jgi:hypothetical protein
MKDFDRYRKEQEKQSDNATSADGAAGEKALNNGANNDLNAELNAEQREALELTKRAFAAYNGKSDAVMLAEILKQAEQLRREGKLTDGEIDSFFAQFSPLLEEGQREKLRSVLERLKRI